MLVHPFVPAYLLLEQKKEEQKLILLWLQHSKLHIYCIQNSPSAVIQSPGSPYANSSISTSSAICFRHLTMRLVLCQICRWTPAPMFEMQRPRCHRGENKHMVTHKMAWMNLDKLLTTAR